MDYITFLKGIHKKSKPGLYFEIGCRFGGSLNVSTAKENIGVDPDFLIKKQISRPTRLFKMTSDDFFERKAEKVFADRKIDLAFIDGMHLAEFAYRDFINVEKYMNPNGIIVVDDIMPVDITYASRTRNTKKWTGDIYKVFTALKKYRPDLQIDVADVAMKGAMVIRKVDPASAVLVKNLAEIEREFPKIDDAVVTAEELRAEMQPRDPDAVLDTIEPIRPAA